MYEYTPFIIINSIIPFFRRIPRRLPPPHLHTSPFVINIFCEYTRMHSGAQGISKACRGFELKKLLILVSVYLAVLWIVDWEVTRFTCRVSHLCLEITLADTVHSFAKIFTQMFIHPFQLFNLYLTHLYSAICSQIYYLLSIYITLLLYKLLIYSGRNEISALPPKFILFKTNISRELENILTGRFLH